MAAGTDELEQQLKQLPLFADVKKSAMKRLLTDVRFRRIAAGDLIVRQGDFTNEMYVLLDGLATATRIETDGSVHVVAAYGAGDWFGEMAVLANQPRTATIKADATCTLLIIDGPLFPKIHGDAKSSFHQLIEERYRERALAYHLATAPLFKYVSIDVRKEIAKGAEIRTYQRDDVIATKGEDADAIYLVRSGIIKRVDVIDGEERIQEYLCDNSSFGERSLTSDRAWPSSYVALSRVDAICVPPALFEDLPDHDATTIRAQSVVLTEQDLGSEMSFEEGLELIVGKEAVKGGEALIIDLTRCTRCNACVESCVAVHEDRVPRLSKRGIRAGEQMLSSACYNCTIPECMLGCGFGAIRRDVQGQIHIIDDNCTGCSICEQKCPYGVISMAQLAEERGATPGWLERLPFVGSLFKRSPEPEPEAAAAKKGGSGMRAIKCDLCAGLPFEACVYNCPYDAIGRKSPEALIGFGDIQYKR